MEFFWRATRPFSASIAYRKLNPIGSLLKVRVISHVIATANKCIAGDDDKVLSNVNKTGYGLSREVCFIFL